MKKFLLVQGPSMKQLGNMQPEIYGTTTAGELDAMCLDHARQNAYQLEILYVDGEGAVIDRISAALSEGLDGLLMNPAAFIHGASALSACITAIPIPYVEVHLTNIERRGLRSVLAPAADGIVAGFGLDSYRMGLEAMCRLTTGRGWGKGK